MQLQSDSFPMEPMRMIYTYVWQRYGTLFRQLTPPYEYMNTPGNTAKLRTAHGNLQTAQSSPSQVGIEPTMH